MLTIVSSVSVIAAVVAAVYAGRQARHAEEQAKHAGTQAQFAEVQAQHSGTQAEVANASYELALTSKKDSEQPYVFVDIRGDDHQPSLAVLIAHNVGPTVAKNIHP